MGADDQFTLEMISATELAGKVLAIGTTEQERKAALAQSLGLDKVPVYVRSSSEEFKKMLLTKPNEKKPKRKENEFQNFLKNLLDERLKTNSKVHFLVLAPPTDLSAVLWENKELAEAVGEIHITDGCCKKCQESKPAPAPLSLNNFLSELLREHTKPTTYNVSMDALATVYLLEMASNREVNVQLISSYLLAQTFNNVDDLNKNFPKLKLRNEANAPADIKIMPLIDEQFSPAGPIAVLAIMDMSRVKPDGMPEFSQFTKLTVRAKKVSLIMPKNGEEKPNDGLSLIMPKNGEKKPKEGHEVEVKMPEDAKNQTLIGLISNFNVQTFGKAMTLILEKIEKQRNAKKLSKKNKGKKIGAAFRQFQNFLSPNRKNK
ncbi:hypothetical protein niasHS_013734 [Heterodera schachtii]|uniref:Uncharacterized protein n=1 Tax=Heterodera schachtii TaxID=97005 RepID=A0ABD2IRS9_HETSC